ncbi:DUF6236 family protein [Shewanella frigidimarina]|uniref:DUF6236 family protein n=1 Tax=Shewanella frigidimarina TaxID=56812 RepID=UPI001FB2BE4D|nr:DUF6236 family protein [Shewanella frigidimarina]
MSSSGKEFNLERGIIASPGIINRLQQGFQMQRSLTIEELQYYILYWDKIVIPGNNLVYIGLPEEDLLLQAGAIERPRVGFQGSFQGDQVTDAIMSCQSLVAKELVKDKSVDWVIHQFGGDSLFPDGFNQRRNVIRVDLSGVLPVPAENINIYEILEFKNRRKDELKQLHAYLDSVYELVLSAPDQELAHRKAISDLSNAINDLDTVFKERFENTKKYDITAELNLNGKDISVGAASGAIIDFFATGMTIPIATVAGAILSTLKVSAKAANTFQPASHNTKLAFLSKAKSEGLL